MSPILLADDSPHAQRMGQQILREEGYEVIGITDGDAVESRLEEIDPDLIVADAFLPLKSGFDLCRYVKNHPLHRHVRVVLTAGLLEQFDEGEAARAGCDAILKKPFEASVMMATIRPLIAEARQAREMLAASTGSAPTIDPEEVEAAVTLALDAAMPALIREVTERVLEALGYSKAASTAAESPDKTIRSPR